MDKVETQIQRILAEAFQTPVEIRPRDFLEKVLASTFAAMQSRGLDMSGDQRKRLNNRELAEAGRFVDKIMRALVSAVNEEEGNGESRT